MPKSEMRAEYDEKRKQLFLDHLAMSSNVTASAEKASVPKSTVYFWRDNDPEFCAAWMKALAAGYDMLEMEMLGRARGGVDKPVYYAGKRIDTIKEYDNATAFKLLAAHKEMVAVTRAAQAAFQENRTNVRETLDRKLNDMRARLLKRKALDQEGDPESDQEADPEIDQEGEQKDASA